MQAQGPPQNAPHLEEAGHRIDVGPCGRHKHAEGEAGIDPLQVLLCGGRAGGEGTVVRLVQPPHQPPDSSPACPRGYSHVGELEEGVKIDVSVKDVHGAALGVGPPAASQRCKLQEGRWVRGMSEPSQAPKAPTTRWRSSAGAEDLFVLCGASGRSCGLLGICRALHRCQSPPRPAGASVAGCCETRVAPGEAPTLRERYQQLESIFVPGYY